MGNSRDGSEHDGGSDGRRASCRGIDALAPRCSRMLEEAGFTYDPRLRAWFNVPAGRVIAFDRVVERTPEWLASWLAGR
jgi:hypothetical protein